MQTDIEVVRGTTNTLKITVTDSSGELYNLDANEKMLFGVKKNHTDSTYIFIKTIETCENGIYTVSLRPEDTELCDCCKYYYDVAIQSGDDFYNVIEASVFHVKKNITKWGCDTGANHPNINPDISQIYVVLDSDGYVLKDSDGYVLCVRGE